MCVVPNLVAAIGEHGRGVLAETNAGGNAAETNAADPENVWSSENVLVAARPPHATLNLS